jgi:hypothetical protein
VSFCWCFYVITFNFRSDESSGNSSDEEDFLDVTDEEQTIETMWKSFDKNGSEAADSKLEETESRSNFDKPTTYEVKQEQPMNDLQFLAGNATNGHLSISQRINMKSLSHQPSSR